LTHSIPYDSFQKLYGFLILRNNAHYIQQETVGVDMEDKNEPDQLREDEEIIELTDVVDESPLEAEEEVVELTGEPDDATEYLPQKIS